MSTCGNCDCADKSQCVKKGNGYGIEIVGAEKSYFDNVINAPAAAENDGMCKCGPACACFDHKCGQ
ncbi:unnamed protein product [Musa acuminata subsp. malaccensis]|uniref:(wild Malaysian banana) hypothetical protein n=1 Tax=Musa acuminata subsp. malaccensis TaxID=214687 RepID=A0A804KGC8_MUSAM|nr:unnamed protein product [Musa acuminata subsp. malaccensis]